MNLLGNGIALLAGDPEQRRLLAERDDLWPNIRPIGERTSRDVATTVTTRKNSAQIRARNRRIETERANRAGTGNANHADVPVREVTPISG